MPGISVTENVRDPRAVRGAVLDEGPGQGQSIDPVRAPGPANVHTVDVGTVDPRHIAARNIAVYTPPTVISDLLGDHPRRTVLPEGTERIA